MSLMKVRVSIDLDLPDVIDKNVNLQDEYVKDITWEMAHVIQTVFDNFLNFAICNHLQAAFHWLGRNKNIPNAKLLAAQHNQWADILRAAESTMKVEKI